MVPLDWVLAVAVLAAPPGGGEVPPRVGEFASLRPTLQALALAWEILDPREADRVLYRAEDFDADVEFLRRRQACLAGAPPLSDCQRFLASGPVGELLVFNRAYRQYLNKRQQVGTPWPNEVRQAMHETDQLYHIYDALRDAGSECYYVTVRREALQRLREAVGPYAYHSGKLPPHVPVWRFARE
jgi:hypothetical protein